LIVAAAVMELDVERAAAKANITTFSDAVWWAMSTVSTVGYGDHYPVTVAGRAIGIVLMIAGMGIFGVTAAAAATWFITADNNEDQRRQAATIAALTAEVTALRQTITQLSARLGSQPRTPARPPSRRHPRKAAAPPSANGPPRDKAPASSSPNPG
jgi:voltage-gated potassium channel